MSPNASQAERSRLILGSLVGVVCFAVYFITLPSSIYAGDSGELVAVTCRSGVAHPPGYPLYLLLAKAFSFVPFGSAAWRLNLLSAVVGALTAGVLFLTIFEWTASWVAGVVGAGMFAFSPSVWKFATVAEVFSLNNFLIVCLLYCLVRYSNRKDPRLVYAGAFLSGLALANHHTSILYSLPMAGLLFWTERKEWFRFDRLVRLFLLVAIGMLPYVYLPLAAQEPKLVSWGNTATFRGLLRHVLRSDYGTFQLTNGEYHPLGPLRSLPNGLGKYLSRLPGETLYLGWCLALFGVVSFARRKTGEHPEKKAAKRGAVLASLYLFGFYLFVFHSLANMPFDAPFKEETISRFWLQPNILVFIWMGLGVSALISLVPDRKRKMFASAMMLALVVAQGARRFSGQNSDESRLYRQYGASFIESLPKGSVLLLMGDLPINTVRYVQECENVRPDVRVLNRATLGKSWIRKFVEKNFPDMTVPPLSDERDIGYFKEFIDANRGRFPIFITGNWEEDIPGGRDADYEVWPRGLADQIVWKKLAPEKHISMGESDAALTSLDGTLSLDLVDEFKNTPWGWMVQHDYWNAHGRLGYRLIRDTSETGYDRNTLVHGTELIREEFSHTEQKNPIFAKALAVAFIALAEHEPSFKADAVAAGREYVTIVPDDPDRNRIVAFIEKNK